MYFHIDTCIFGTGTLEHPRPTKSTTGLCVFSTATAPGTRSPSILPRVMHHLSQYFSPVFELFAMLFLTLRCVAFARRLRLTSVLLYCTSLRHSSSPPRHKKLQPTNKFTASKKKKHPLIFSVIYIGCFSWYHIF